MRRLLIGAALAAGLLAAGPVSALVVFDPANYAQNVLTAARALEEVQNQLVALQNQARNLAPLGYSAGPALARDMGRVNALLADAGRIANSVGAVRQAFDQTYSGAPSAAEAALVASATARWETSLEAFRHVLEVQATVAAAAPDAQAQAGALLDRSQGATGALQAAQAGNQMLAVQARQLADLTALMTVQSRATALEQARWAAAAADGRLRLQRFLGARP